MKSIIKVLKYVKPYKIYAFLSVGSNIIQVIFHLLSILTFLPLLNVLFREVDPILVEPQFELSMDYFESLFSYKMTPYVEANGKEGALFFICIVVSVLFFIKNLFRYLAKFFIANIRSGVVRDIRRDVYEKILILPLSFYSEEKKGDIISRITGDVQEIEWSIMNSLEMLFRDPISIIISLGIMVGMNLELTIFSFVLLPISGYIIGQVGKSLTKTSAKLQIRMGELLSNIEETLGGLRIIKSFNAEQSSNQKFRGINEIYRNTMLRMFRKRDLASPISETLGASVMMLLVWFGGNMVLDPEVSFTGTQFLAYIAVFYNLLTPAKSLSTAYYNIQKGAASTERIDMILEAENSIKEPNSPVILDQFRKAIEFKNVNFSYSKEPILKDINLSIEKGKTIALVGQSGGGKSTLVDLIPRFYDVNAGGIFIDGQNIKNIGLKNLRSLMGIVSQSSILFNDSVFNNITLGVPHATMNDVIQAAKIANAHEFIVSLSEGYDTNIGDSGGKLSGGQKQRLSIARAVLKNPPILILDEATSALDTESEKLVQDALVKLMENRTSIVIAHRLSTIQHADEIIVINEGEIAERGPHDSLIAQNGMYKKLTDLQTFT